MANGIFTLLHSFDINYSGDSYKDKTSNLMDYSTGSELAVWQWNVVHNPAPMTWFDSEEDSYAPWLTTGTQSIYRFFHLYQCALKRGGTFDFHRLGSEEPYHGEIKVNGKKIKIILRLPKDLTDYYPQKNKSYKLIPTAIASNGTVIPLAQKEMDYGDFYCKVEEQYYQLLNDFLNNVNTDNRATIGKAIADKDYKTFIAVR